MKKNKKYKEVVINTCYGGFGLSDEAYEELIKLGVPVRKYIPEKRSPKTGKIIKNPNNEGRVIFDNELTPIGEDEWNDKMYWDYKESGATQRYWDVWTRYDRENPLVIRVVKGLGKKANGPYAELKIVKIPADVEYEIEENDGLEWIAEKHMTWY